MIEYWRQKIVRQRAGIVQKDWNVSDPTGVIADFITIYSEPRGIP